MDILFGTYRCPPHEPEGFGVSEAMPKSYLGQLAHPFRSTQVKRGGSGEGATRVK
jgi:hypothetical protein